MAVDDGVERPGQICERIDGIKLAGLNKRGDGDPVPRSGVMAGACKATAHGPARPVAHRSYGLIPQGQRSRSWGSCVGTTCPTACSLAILKAAIQRRWRPPRSISKRVKTSSVRGSDRYPRSADVARRAERAFQFAEKVSVASNLSEFTNPIGRFGPDLLR